MEPAGLVERDSEAIETEGGANDADVFRVTEWGEMYLGELDEPPMGVEDAAEVRVSLAEAVGRVEDLETRIDGYEARLGEETQEFDSLGSRTVSQFLYPSEVSELKEIEQNGDG